MTEAVSAGLPKSRIEESAAKKQAAIDQGLEVIVGVNKYKPKDHENVEILNVDNISVRKSQIDRLNQIRATRDNNICQKKLEDLENICRNKSGNILEFAVDAARNRATVGEISSALENVFGRYRANNKTLTGVYKNAYENDESFLKIQNKVELFEKNEGRRPRILVIKLGQDGHDRGAKVIATAFADIGFDADVGPLFQTQRRPKMLLIMTFILLVFRHKLPLKNFSTYSHRSIKKINGEEIIVVCGGVIPREDYDFLSDIGVRAIFGPGTNILDAANNLLDILLGN